MRVSLVSAQRSGSVYAAAVCALGLLGYQLFAYHSIADDAYISFRYLDHWLSGLGLVYNPGERVEGYTNFLWIVVLAPLRWLGVAPESASLLASLGALVLLLVSVYRGAAALAGCRVAGWAALVVATGSVALARWTVSGMETVCFAALLALANAQLAVHGRHARASSMIFGLAALTRPTGVLHAAVAFLAALLFSGSSFAGAARRLLAPGLLFAALPALHLGFRLLYYGAPLPNTFYAKLGGETPDLIPSGLAYLGGFLASGAAVLLVTALPALRCTGSRRWVVFAIAGQVAAQMLYSVYVGGDYFPFHRFLVPAVPGLAMLAGVGLARLAQGRSARLQRLLPASALLLALLQVGLARFSPQQAAFEAVSETRTERERIAAWLADNLGPETTLAINAAGVIPYRTGFRTIDMLGLNDGHIARSGEPGGGDGFTFVGHHKHDGRYVCERAPAVVLTSGARLHRGRSAEEAVIQAAVNTFPGDREFLRDPGCRDRYEVTAIELLPERYLVLYLRRDRPADDAKVQPAPVTAEAWFRHGIALMQGARLSEAADAFRKSLQLQPGNPAALTNLGFCLSDLARYEPALEAFEAALANDPGHHDALFGMALATQRMADFDRAAGLWQRYLREAPESAWKEAARKHLRQLSPHAPPVYNPQRMEGE